MMKTNLDKAYYLIEQISLPCIIQHANDLGQWLSDIREELRECVKSCQLPQENGKKQNITSKNPIELVTIAEVTERTGLTRYTLTEMLKSSNPPPHVKMGRNFLIDYSAFCEWFKKQSKAGTEYQSRSKHKIDSENTKENTRNKYSDLVGVRYNARNHHWQAEIRRNYVTYYLGSYDEAKNGYEKAKSARLEAERIMDLGVEYFKAWYAMKYPQSNPIDRTERGYVK